MPVSEMNGAIKRTKQLRRFLNMLLTTIFVLFTSLLFFVFFFELSVRNLPKPLQGNSVQPQDFVLMNTQN